MEKHGANHKLVLNAISPHSEHSWSASQSATWPTVQSTSSGRPCDLAQNGDGRDKSTTPDADKN